MYFLVPGIKGVTADISEAIYSPKREWKMHSCRRDHENDFKTMRFLPTELMS